MKTPIQNMINAEVEGGSTALEALNLIMSERTGEEFDIWEYKLGEVQYGDFYESDWLQTVQVYGRFQEGWDGEMIIGAKEFIVTNGIAELNQYINNPAEVFSARTLQINDLINNWSKCEPSRQNKTYRKDEVGMVGDGVQFITFLSCDSISEFAEGYEPDEEPEEEGEWFAVFKYEDLVKQLHAELKYFNTNFNVTIEDVNYGTDVIISIDFDTLHTMSDEDFAKLLKYDVTDLQYDFVWEALNRVVEIVFEKASD